MHTWAQDTHGQAVSVVVVHTGFCGSLKPINIFGEHFRMKFETKKKDIRNLRLADNYLCVQTVLNLDVIKMKFRYYNFYLREQLKLVASLLVRICFRL